MKRIYNIQWPKLIQQLTPTMLRHAVWQAWLMALIYPITQLHSRLLAFKKSTDYQLYITPQVCYLTRLCNDRFDAIQRRIIIGDSADQLPSFIYQNAENKPLYLDTITLYTDGEAGQIKNDFVIKMPSGLAFDMAELRALINNYKLAGTKYAVQII